MKRYSGIRRTVEQVSDDGENFRFYDEEAPNILVDIHDQADPDRVHFTVHKLDPITKHIISSQEMSHSRIWSNGFYYLSFKFEGSSYSLIAAHFYELIYDVEKVCKRINSLLNSIKNDPRFLHIENILDYNANLLLGVNTKRSIEKIQGFLAFLKNTKLEDNKIMSCNIEPEDLNHLSPITIDHLYKVDLKQYKSELGY